MWALQFTLLCLIERPNRTEKAKKGIIGITACIFFSSIHQKMTMDLDRTNRLFYKNVIINEKRKKDYQELDSLIHSSRPIGLWSIETLQTTRREGYPKPDKPIALFMRTYITLIGQPSPIRILRLQ